MRALLIAIIALFVWGLGPSQAWAHAELLSSNPAADQVFAKSPAQILLRFNEPVEAVFVRLIDSRGNEVRAKTLDRDGADLRLELDGALVQGTYLVSYRVISADTHPVGGSFAFSVGMPSQRPTEARPEMAPSAWAGILIGVRGALYAAMLLASGSALFVAIVAPPTVVERTTMLGARAASAVGILASILICGVGGADQLGADLTSIVSSASWAEGIKSTLGEAAAIGIAGLLVLLFGFEKRSRFWLALGAFTALLSFSVTGHAATAVPIVVSAPTVFLHAATAAFWGGALFPLLTATVRLKGADAQALMERFSRAAVAMVGLLVLSGLVLTYIQVRTPAAMLNTPYGLRLIAKLIGVAALIALAATNRFVFTRRLQTVPSSASRMRFVIGAEFALYFFIAVVAASLTTTPPPRTLRSDLGSTTVVVSEYPYKARVDVSPGKGPTGMITVAVTDAQDVRLHLASMTLTLAPIAGGIEPIALSGRQMADGAWRFDTTALAIPGVWTLTLSAYLDGFNKVDFSARIDLGSR